MPFCRAMLSAKRFIAGVGGNVPGASATAAPSNGGSPGCARDIAFRGIPYAGILFVGHGFAGGGG
jgi:hypothetical protein